MCIDGLVLSSSMEFISFSNKIDRSAKHIVPFSKLTNRVILASF